MARVLFASRTEKRRRVLVKHIGHHHRLALAATAQEALSAIAGDDFDVFVTDLSFRHRDNLHLLRHSRRLDETLSILFVFVPGDMQAVTSVSAAGVGADLVAASFNTPRGVRQIVEAIASAADCCNVRRRARAHKAGRADRDDSDGRLICASASMKKVVSAARRLGDYDGPVLIQGPTGSGKELVALTIHEHSRFCKGEFVPVNVTTLRPEIAPSELFGHAKGAFTGATDVRQGLFKKANGGTLVLDEIGDLAPDLQAVLLRVVEDKVITPVGSTDRIPLNLRIVACTNRPLQLLVEHGVFRKDLYFRLNSLTLDVPPLAERPEDIDALAEHFMVYWGRRQELPGLCMDPRALEMLRAHHWDGNVRELKAKMHLIVSLCDSDVVTTETVARALATKSTAEDGECDFSVPLNDRIDEVCRQHLTAALQASRHKQRRAAQLCGLKYHTFRYQARRLGVLGDDADEEAEPNGVSATSAKQMGVNGDAILIVDDNEDLLSALRRVLRADCEVNTARTGKEALQTMARRDDFVLVLCDVVMPDMTGVELHGRVKRWRPQLAERFVFMSGHFDEPDVSAFVQGIALPTLSKPFEPERVKELVNQRRDRLH